MKEHELQTAARDAINLTDMFRAVIIDVGLKPYKDRKTGEWKWIKTHADAGVADIYVQSKNRWGFWLEVKTGRNKQMKKQKEFQEKIEAAGGAYYVVRSVQQALEACFKEMDKMKEFDFALSQMLTQMGG